MYMRSSVIDPVARSVGQSVDHTSEPCKNGWTDLDAISVEDSAGPRNHVSDWGPYPPICEGAILRGKGLHCKVYGHSKVSTGTCAKTAEPIVMPFELWAQTRPRNHELDGDPDPVLC